MSEDLLTALDDQSTAESIEPKWFIDEGIPGIGDRPAWLNDKFKTVADLGKSYAELEKKFGSVPENYDISRSMYFDPNDPEITGLLEVAKEKRVPKEVIDKMVDTFDNYLGKYDVNPEEEAKKLGDNAKERLTTLNNWAKANLSDNAYKAISKSAQSADAILALEEIRSKMMSSSTLIPGGNDNSGSEVNTLESVKQEIINNLEKYKTDPKYRTELQGKLEMAAKHSGLVDKQGN